MRIWKGSNQEVTVSIAPCGKYNFEVTNLTLDFYTVGENSIRFSGDSITLSGKNATVVFQPAELELLPDGALMYISTFDYLNDTEIYSMSSGYYLKTPANYVTQHFVTLENIVQYVDSAMTGYTTTATTNELSTSTSDAISGINEDIAELQEALENYATTATTNQISEQLSSSTQEINSAITNIEQSLENYATTAVTETLAGNIGTLSGDVADIQSGLTELEYSVSVKQDTLIPGEGITISGVTISSDVPQEELDRLIQHVDWEGSDGNTALSALTDVEAGTIVYRGTKEPYIISGVPLRNHGRYGSWHSVFGGYFDISQNYTPLFWLEDLEVQITYDKNENKIFITDRLGALKYSATGVTLPSAYGEEWTDEQVITFEVSGNTYSERILVTGYEDISDVDIYVENYEANGEKINFYIPGYTSVSPCYPTPGKFYRRNDSDTGWEDLVDTSDLDERLTELESEVALIPEYSAGSGISISADGVISCTVSGGTSGVTSGEVQTMIESAIAAETARTEETYATTAVTEALSGRVDALEESTSSLTNYTAGYGIDITNNVISCTVEPGSESGITSGMAQQMITNAIETETARTEQTYAKIAALSGYATETWVQQQGYLTGISGSDVATTADTAQLSAEISAKQDSIGDAGNEITPVYFTGGTATPVKLSASGSRFGCVPVVSGNGVMEVGYAIDFHRINSDQGDYGARILYGSGDGVVVNYTATGNATSISNVNSKYLVDSRDVLHIVALTQAEYNSIQDRDNLTLYIIV